MDGFLAFVFAYRGALFPLAMLVPLILPVEPRGPWHYGIGFCMVALGLFFRIMGVCRIGGRARVHSAGARHLLTSGIFGHVRNPLYVGNSLTAGGLVALYFSLYGAPVTFFFLVGLYTLIILHEERMLLQQMGEPYAQYLRTVPRWLPSLTYRGGAGSGDPLTPWRDVLRYERFFLLFGAGLAIVSVSWHRWVLPALAPDSPFSMLGRVLFAFGLVGLIVLVLFLKVAAGLKKKRGSWLKTSRISGT